MESNEHRQRPEIPVTKPGRFSRIKKLPRGETAQTIRPPKLHSAFKEAAKTGEVLRLEVSEMPWLSEPVDVGLNLITLAHSNDNQFYYGSAIRSKDLVAAANYLDRRRSGIATNLLYTRLPDFVTNRTSPLIWEVDGAMTRRKIYYVGNVSGQRSYFMVFDNLEGKPVIIRVAVCDKSQQRLVLGVLTGRSRKVIDYLGKL